MPRNTTEFVPKYYQLVEQFRRRIETGVLRPGDQLPSFTEMRASYGASRPTVERLHDILESEGLITREPKRGIFVAEPRPRATRAVIGYYGYSTHHPYHVSMLRGVNDVVQRERLELVPLRESSAVQWEKIDGVLLSTMNPQLHLGGLPPGMPHVALLIPVDGVPNVVVDEFRGGYLAAQHLLTLGHRRIACMTAGDMLWRQRLAGYRAAMREAGIRVDPRWIRHVPLEKSGRSFVDRAHDVMRGWFADDWDELRCTGLLAQNDDAAIGAVHTLEQHGYSVPRDVSVVGYDGTDVSRFFTPRLTTVEVPLREMSARGTELLLQLLNRRLGTPAPDTGREVLPVQLVARESTAPPRIGS